MRFFHFKERYDQNIAPRRTREGRIFEAVTMVILLMSIILELAVWRKTGTPTGLKKLALGIIGSLAYLLDAYQPSVNEYGSRAKTPKQRLYATRGIRIMAIMIALITLAIGLYNAGAITQVVEDVIIIGASGVFFLIWTSMLFLIQKIR
ncbi:MAG: hypothetical protein LKG25_01465 [Prevotella sp.]|jgi:hypothetical protein|nr:hypothetical protein [Prevotella sp.]MCI1281246.1 hypothetical protein [Prevotella sp.]